MTADTRRRITIFVVVGAVVIGLAAIAFMFIRGTAPQTVSIDEKNFPDASLRQTVALEADLDGNSILSQEELAAVERFDLSDVMDLQGVDLFPGLTELIITSPDLVDADVTGCESLVTLEFVDCPHVETLAVGDCPELVTLVAQDTQLAQIDLSGVPKLIDLHVDDTVQLLNIEMTPLREYWAVSSYSITHPSVNDVPSYTESAQAQFDEAGHLTTIEVTTDEVVTYAYEYDERNNCIAMTDSGAAGAPPTHWTIEYDELDRIVRATDDFQDTWEYGYEEESRSPQYARYVFQNGVIRAVEFEYGDAGLIDEFLLDTGHGPDEFEVRYEHEDQLQYIGEKDSSVANPQVYRITRANGSISTVNFRKGPSVAYTQTYSYGSNGRLTDVKRELESPNQAALQQYPQIASATFGYDDFGLPITWEAVYIDADNGDEQLTGHCEVTYHRLLSTNERPGYARALSVANIINPSVSAYFWSPAYDFIWNLSALAYKGMPTFNPVVVSE